MKQERLSVISCRDLNGTVFELKLAGASVMRAGQFVELSVPGFFLRRPISVADSDESALTLLIKTVGEGTKKLRTLAAGDVLDALTGLGNGFALTGERPLLAGGGIGSWDRQKYDKGFSLGALVQVGVEYTFSNIPLLLSLDYRPGFYFLPEGRFDFRGIAVGVRYCF